MLFQRYKKRKQFTTYRLGERYQDIWEQPKTHNTPTPTMLYNASFDTMLSKLETATKAVGRYHIGINMKYGGHVITAERLVDGRVLYRLGFFKGLKRLILPLYEDIQQTRIAM
ncbi:MAG: hypothetical protein ACTTIA_05790 [Candidatus Cryptobacteroides sp.]